MLSYGLNTCQRLVNQALLSLWSFNHQTLPQVQLVILLFIDPATPAHPTPKISIELWRGIPLGSQDAQTKEGHMVWQDDWTHNAGPFYILLADIFRGEVPPEYGVHDRIFLASASWRQGIIESYQ